MFCLKKYCSKRQANAFTKRFPHKFKIIFSFLFYSFFSIFRSFIWAFNGSIFTLIALFPSWILCWISFNLAVCSSFRFNSFIEHLGTGWKIPEEKIAQKLKDRCNVEFDHSLNVDGKTLKVCKLPQLFTPQIEHKPIERKGSNY